jgi:hypothetical protein
VEGVDDDSDDDFGDAGSSDETHDDSDARHVQHDEGTPYLKMASEWEVSSKFICEFICTHDRHLLLFVRRQ